MAVDHKLKSSLLILNLGQGFNTWRTALNVSIAANEEFESGGKRRELGRLEARARDSPLGMVFNKGTDHLYGVLAFGNNRRHQVPDVHLPVPHFKGDIHTRLLCRLIETYCIVE